MVQPATGMPGVVRTAWRRIICNAQREAELLAIRPREARGVFATGKVRREPLIDVQLSIVQTAANGKLIGCSEWGQMTKLVCRPPTKQRDLALPVTRAVQHSSSIMANVSPTAENYLGLHTPQPDYDLDDRWRWPYWKFGFESPEVLFTTLHADYNSMQFAIQEPLFWYRDVCEIANIAQNRGEFEALLEQRKQRRFDEAQSVWERAKALLTAEPSRLKNPPAAEVLWVAFITLARNLSFDSLVKYFGSYIANDNDRNPPLPPMSVEARPANPDRRKGKTRSGQATPSHGTTTRSSKISKTRLKRAGSQVELRRSQRLRDRPGQ